MRILLQKCTLLLLDLPHLISTWAPPRARTWERRVSSFRKTVANFVQVGTVEIHPKTELISYPLALFMRAVGYWDFSFGSAHVSYPIYLCPSVIRFVLFKPQIRGRPSLFDRSKISFVHSTRNTCQNKRRLCRFLVTRTLIPSGARFLGFWMTQNDYRSSSWIWLQLYIGCKIVPLSYHLTSLSFFRSCHKSMDLWNLHQLKK